MSYSDGEAAYAAALKLLKTRERFAAEIRQALSVKGFEESAVAWALDRLTSRGLVDDLGLAKRIVVSRQTLKKTVGPEMMRELLAKRGASEEVLAEALADFAPNAASLLSRFDPTDQTSIPRAGRFLASRGFNQEEIELSLETYFHSQ